MHSGSGLTHLKAPSTTNLALTEQTHYEIPFGPPPVALLPPPSSPLPPSSLRSSLPSQISHSSRVSDIFAVHLNVLGRWRRRRGRGLGNGEMGTGTFEGKEQIRNVLFISFPEQRPFHRLLLSREGKRPVSEECSSYFTRKREGGRERDFHLTPDGREATLLLLLFAIATLHRDYRLIAPLSFPPSLSLRRSRFSKALFKRQRPRAAEFGTTRVIFRLLRKWKNVLQSTLC